MASDQRQRQDVLSVPIDILDWQIAENRIMTWAQARQSKYVCICNVHSVVTAKNNTAFRSVLQQADMATPDGMPVAWLMRGLGIAGQDRINGPDLMWRLCNRASTSDLRVFFYGGSDQTLDRLQQTLRQHFPALQIAGMLSPPYRELTADEIASDIRQINASGAGLVFVCLGCPKQEHWMARHRSRIQAVTIGVGAAFAYHAGTLERAPSWMQKNGLEWFYRLIREPRRLWKRYLVTNTQFLIFATHQYVMSKLAPKRQLKS
jgi:N-acetylglucosaminyldiphosphoundecaprenol N-acetyl-beta-D-mannosaminyltransferase